MPLILETDKHNTLEIQLVGDEKIQNNTLSDTEIEQMLIMQAKQLMAQDGAVEREKKVTSFLNKIIPLDEVRTGKVSKFVFESLTK